MLEKSSSIMDNKKIGKLIAKQRKQQGLTQQQLGDMVGVGFRAVSKWERGLTLPDTSLINELSKILGISSDELLTGEIKQETSNNKHKNNSTIIKVTLLVLLSITIIITIFTLIKNKTYTYDLINISNDYYIEGTISIKKNNISVVINQLEILDNNINETIITNYEYNMTSNNQYIFRYGYNFLGDNIGNKQKIKDVLKEFNVKYNGQTDISRTDIEKNNLILNFNFIDETGNEMSKKIEIKLVEKSEKNSVKTM